MTKKTILKTDIFFIILTAVSLSSVIGGPAKAKGEVLPSLTAQVTPVFSKDTTEGYIVTPIIEEKKNNEKKAEENLEVHAKKAEGKYKYLLEIPKISVDAPVLGFGLTEDGLMAVPDNYSEVGWYSYGARPGERGNAVLGAHVDDGAAIDGVFKNLKNLKRGDDIFIYDRDGRKLNFRVTKKDIYDYRLEDTSVVFGKTGKRQVKIITCYGNFLKNVNTYDQRLVITAELV